MAPTPAVVISDPKSSLFRKWPGLTRESLWEIKHARVLFPKGGCPTGKEKVVVVVVVVVTPEGGYYYHNNNHPSVLLTEDQLLPLVDHI